MGGGRVGGWEVGDGRAKVTGKFDSIDSIVDRIRCWYLWLVGWAWSKYPMTLYLGFWMILVIGILVTVVRSSNCWERIFG